MKTYTINVTSRDIKLGKKREGTACPIASSCKRIFKKNFDSISPNFLYLKRITGVELPRKAKDFVKNFDNYNKVKPFSFKIRL